MKKHTNSPTSSPQDIKRLTRLSQLSMALSSNGELKSDLKLIARYIREAVKADESFFMLLNRDSFQLVLNASSGKPRKRPTIINCQDHRDLIHSTEEYGFLPCAGVIKNTVVHLDGEALALAKCFETRQRQLFNGEKDIEIFQNTPYRSAMVIPLQTQTQCVGLLVVANLNKAMNFSASTLEEATIFANLAALRVEHITLLNDREKQIDEMEKLNQLAKQFSVVNTFDGLIGLSFNYLSEIIHYDIGVVSLFNDEEEKRYYVSNNLLEPDRLNALTAHINDVSNKLSPNQIRTVKKQQIFLKDQNSENLQPFKGKLKSFITVPLATHGKSIGMITMTTTSKNAFTRENLRTFSTLSNLLATAVENVKIRLDLEKRIDEVSVLLEISQSITSTLFIDEVLDSIVNFSIEMMNALRCELRLLDDKGEYLEVKASTGLSKSYLTSRKIKKGEGILGSCLEKKRPLSVADVGRDARTRDYKALRAENVAGILTVPILQHNRAVGVIAVYTSKPHEFSQSEIDLLSTFASQASIAIENAQLYAEMKNQYMSMISALAAAIEAKDSYTHGHSTNVMEYAVKISKALGLEDNEVENVKYAGLLHDIGKIGVKDVILSKQGKLTSEEVAELRKHPVYGANIMEKVAILKDIAPLALYHHERFDGNGYPLGLKGEEIPLGARILAVADTYDAMIADRPYRKAFPFDFVKNEMFKAAGSQLDPKLVKIFFEILKNEGIEK